jgi:DNA-binding protein HU-beta
MNKKELVELVAKSTDVPVYKVDDILTAAFKKIVDLVSAGDRVKIVNFGCFDSKYHKEKVGRNPKTNQVVSIAAGYRPVFKAGKPFKQMVGRRNGTSGR